MSGEHGGSETSNQGGGMGCWGMIGIAALVIGALVLLYLMVL
jgi:hypothetical protein